MDVFDSHFHIIDLQFPLVENNGYMPPTFTAHDYSVEAERYNIAGGAIVSGSFQAFDQSYLIDALQKLGNRFYGVANIPVGMPEADLDMLNNNGVVAVRFNLKRGDGDQVAHIESLSSYLFEKYGWHTELYIDSKELAGLRSVLKNIKKFSIDHLGLSNEGLPELYYWVEKGVKIKATGFGRIDFDPVPAMKKIYEINPKALMFGTDLPSTRARVPFSKKDLDLIKSNFDDEALNRILTQNALAWYSKKE
jgi:predicted TIM-barrel fold metal-dependent hydrolase